MASVPKAAAGAAGCEESACRSRGDMFRAMKRMAPAAGGAQQPHERGGDGAAAQPPPECPPLREELGRASWTLMHSLAAHYPHSPGPYERAHAAAFYRALAALYPCTHCRDDFHAAVAADPPRVESREALSVWLCRQHNVVNAKLGKPAFPCDFGALDARWRTGARECWAEDAETAAQSLGQE